MCWNDLAKKAWASNMTHGSHKWQHLKHHFASNFGQHIVESWDLTITRAGAQWGLKPGGPAAARLLINQLSPPAEIWRSPHRVLPIGRLLPDLRSNHLSFLHLLQVTFPDPKTSHGHNVVTRCCRLQGDWFLLLASKSICRICGTLRSVTEIIWSSGQSAEAYMDFGGWQQVFEASMANWRRVKVEEKQRRGWWTSSWAGPGVAKGDWWNKNFQTFLNLSFWNNVQSFTNSFCSFEPALWCQRGDGM